MADTPLDPKKTYKVWIDQWQDLCTGDGLCSEIAPDVFYPEDTGLWHVKETAEHFGKTVYFAKSKGNEEGHRGLARVPDEQLDIVIEAAEECPGECIFIEEVE